MSDWDIEAAVLQGLLLRRHEGGDPDEGQLVRDMMRRYEDMAHDRRSVEGMLALLDLEADDAMQLGAKVDQHVDLLRGTAEWLVVTPAAERELARVLIAEGLLTAPKIAQALKQRVELLANDQRHGLFQILVARGSLGAAELAAHIEQSEMVVLVCPECSGIGLALPTREGQAVEVETCGSCLVEMAPHTGMLDPDKLEWADYEKLTKTAATDPVQPGGMKEEPTPPTLHVTASGRRIGAARGSGTSRRSRRISRASRVMPAAESEQKSGQQALVVIAVVIGVLAMIVLALVLFG